MSGTEGDEVDHQTEGEIHQESYIIAAGEVAKYVFCPESWRLSKLQGVVRDSDAHERAQVGEADHASWSETVDELEALRFGLRVLFGLCIIACLVYQLGR
jgi:hypothetical protein